jgi:hypothetical protein
VWEGLTFHIRNTPCCRSWREATNVWKRWFQNGLRWVKVTKFWPWHVPNTGELDFKHGPLIFRVTNIHFQLQSNTEVEALQDHHLGLELKMNKSTQRKRVATIKPSSPKLGICQGQFAFTLVYCTSFRNHFFRHLCYVWGVHTSDEWCYWSSHKAFKGSLKCFSQDLGERELLYTSVLLIDATLKLDPSYRFVANSSQMTSNRLIPGLSS